MAELKIKPYANIIWSISKGNSSPSTSGSAMVRRYKYSSSDDTRAFTANYDAFPSDANILNNITDIYISITASTLLTDEWVTGDINVAAFSAPIDLTDFENLYPNTVASQNNIIARTYNISESNTYYIYRDGKPLTDHWEKIKNGIFWYFVDDANETQRVYHISSAEITIVYNDVFAAPVVSTVKPVYGENILSSEKFTVEWEYEQEAGVLQKYIEIEYSSNDGETWEELVSKREYSSKSIDVDAASLPVGLVRLRVKAYSQKDIISNYAETAIYIRVQASTSSVSFDGKPHPTVSWKASYQIAYQVKFADYDSGPVYGSENSHTIPYYYADGNYPVQVRTQAANGMWSDWTEIEYVSVMNSPPAGSVTLAVEKTQHTIVASWNSTETWDAYILYRNDIPVYIGKNTSYTDIAAYASCNYYVRAVYGKNYIQSNAVSVEAKPDVDCLYDTHLRQWVQLKYSLQPRSRSYSENANIVYKYYAGRSYPVAYTDNTFGRQLNVSYVFKKRADAEKLKAARGHLVIYKDTNGGRIIGILETLSWKATKYYEAEIKITQVDYKEAVRYET